VAAYCRRVGRDKIAHWPFYLAFSFFRSASIVQGVYHRGLQGNASSANEALLMRERAVTAANTGLMILERAAV
jgi:aminoglycoside phosphotransferase (APT) family kinase protein